MSAAALSGLTQGPWLLRGRSRVSGLTQGPWLLRERVLQPSGASGLTALRVSVD
jgi:hypothetical protein